MSISKINNISNSITSQNQLLRSRNVKSFGSDGGSDLLDDAYSMDDVNSLRMPEERLKAIASMEPNQRYAKVLTNVLNTLLIAVPVIDSAASVFVKKGNLSSKLKAGASNAGKWAAVFAAGIAVSGAKKYINSKSEKLDNFDKKHGFLSTVVDFTAIYTAFSMLSAAGKHLYYSSKNAFPRLADKMHRHVKTPLKSFINSSFVNKKIVLPMEKYSTKHPHFALTSSLAATLAAPVVAVAAVSRAVNEAKSRNEAIQANYEYIDKNYNFNRSEISE